MDALGINLPGLVTQLVSFAILFAVLWMLLYKPISKAMGDRSKKIQDSLEAADKAREEDKIVAVKSRKEVPYSHWMDITGIIEDAGGVITLQLEEEQTVQVQ